MTHSVNPSDNVWLIITPENRLCAWFYFDPVLSYDSESTLVRFEPDPNLRRTLVADGWTVRSGTIAELESLTHSLFQFLGSTGLYAKASA
ncbi:hypothetical protein [Mycobacterium intracellulare]|uniref:DUF1828 domain-containing protein n=1 Tax=Mycobacterium intracellulare subsp. chimaera TaxID=222805 RepID=A0ABT7P3G2_MYCIT|nr:hypothetical protein [Mycobacterium intracellulare]MDM3927789.1 hypothetical protein [Mycobacterium intracellulare subsp. chimaera]